MQGLVRLLLFQNCLLSVYEQNDMTSGICFKIIFGNRTQQFKKGTTTWMNLTENVESRDQTAKKYIRYDSLYTKIKNRPNQPFKLQVRIVDTLPGKMVMKIRTAPASGWWALTGREQQGAFWGDCHVSVSCFGDGTQEQVMVETHQRLEICALHCTLIIFQWKPSFGLLPLYLLFSQLEEHLRRSPVFLMTSAMEIDGPCT